MSKPKTYAEKLRDPRWQKLRLEIMQRDGFKCCECRDKDNTLNVHHRFYLKGANPWEYDSSSLVTLCEKCHTVAERERDFIQRQCAGPSYIQTFIAQVLTAKKEPRCPHLMHALDALSAFLNEWNDAVEDPHLGGCVESLNSSFRLIVVELGKCIQNIERLSMEEKK